MGKGQKLIVDTWEAKPKSKIFDLFWFAKTYYRKNLIKLTVEYLQLKKKYDDLQQRYDGLLRDLLQQTINSPTLTKEEELILQMIENNEKRKDMCIALNITHPTLMVRLKALEKKGMIQIDGRKITLTKR